MKKYLLTGCLLAALAVAMLVGAQVWVNAMQDDVTYKETVVYGDSSAAEGVKVTNKINAGHTKLYWTTDYTIKASGSVNSKTTCYTDKPAYYKFNQQYLHLDTGLSTERTSSNSNGLELPKRGSVQKILEDVADRAKNGTTNTEQIHLSDYFHYMPINVGSDWSPAYLHCAEYFKAPVPKYAVLTAAVQKDKKGQITKYSTMPAGISLHNVSKASGKGFYFAFTTFDVRDQLSGDGIEDTGYPIPEKINGVHFIPFSNATVNTENKIPDFQHASKIYPMKENEKTIAIDVSKDNSKVYLVYKDIDSQKAYLAILDSKTGKRAANVFLGNAREYTSVDAILEKNNAVLLRVSETTDSFCLVSEENGEYQRQAVFALDKKMMKHFDLFDVDFDYDGEKLVIAANSGHYHNYHNAVFVYTKDGLQFFGKYTPSNHHTGSDDISDDASLCPVTVTLPR